MSYLEQSAISPSSTTLHNVLGNTLLLPAAYESYYSKKKREMSLYSMIISVPDFSVYLRFLRNIAAQTALKSLSPCSYSSFVLVPFEKLALVSLVARVDLVAGIID